MKTYGKARIIKMVWDWQKDRQLDSTESPEVDSQKHSRLVLDKGRRTQYRKVSSSVNSAGTPREPSLTSMKLGPNVVAQWVRQPSERLASHLGTGLHPCCSTLWQLPLNDLGKQQEMTQAFRSLYPLGRPGWNSRVLAAVCPRPDCCGHLGEWKSRWNIPLFLFLLISVILSKSII